MATAIDPAPPSKLGHAVICLLAIASWGLLHSYAGIVHDAGLYTLQALARLHPAGLSADVFLKFGSQDRFTLFSPIYAEVSRWFGVEPAAALLTLAFQLGLAAGAWALARSILPLPMALLGVAVFLAIPGHYGPGRIFTCIEPYLTPRMAAEAMVLGSLAFAMRGLRLPATLLVVAAALLHPIMAMAGLCAMYWLYACERRRVGIALAIIAAAAMAVAAFAMPPGSWGRFDADWLLLVKNRSPYLFLGFWQIDDWSRAAVTLATLSAGRIVLATSAAGRLAKITLITCLSGLMLTLIACDLLHLVPVTQVQPWRWLWLGTAVSALLLPQILRSLWGSDRPARATGLLLLGAWVFAANPYALVAATAATASLTWTPRLRDGESRWIFYGAIGLFVIAAGWRLASNLEFTESHFLDPNLPSWFRLAMSFAYDGSAPAALLASVWWMAHTTWARPGLLLFAGLAGAGCAALAPVTLRNWTRCEFTAQQMAQFAPLREAIPIGSEVFWPESPLAVWMLLERPSYLSVIQTSGLVFSLPAARELRRRAGALEAAVDADTFMNWKSAGTGMNLSKQQLETACASGEFDFLVTPVRLDLEALAAVAAATGPASKRIRLYRCGKGTRVMA